MSIAPNSASVAATMAVIASGLCHVRVVIKRTAGAERVDLCPRRFDLRGIAKAVQHDIHAGPRKPARNPQTNSRGGSVTIAVLP